MFRYFHYVRLSSDNNLEEVFLMLQNADMRTACTLNIELPQRKKVY